MSIDRSVSVAFRIVTGHVFISYGHSDDVGYVERLAAYLRAEGVQVWFDGEIPSGDRWEMVIRERIDSCLAFVVVMTPGGESAAWLSLLIALGCLAPAAQIQR
jgi:hypothetical protein